MSLVGTVLLAGVLACALLAAAASTSGVCTGPLPLKRSSAR